MFYANKSSVSLCKIYNTLIFSMSWNYAQFAYEPEYITSNENAGGGLLEQCILLRLSKVASLKNRLQFRIKESLLVR